VSVNSNLSNVGLTNPSISEGGITTLTGTLRPSTPTDTMSLVIDWADSSNSPTTLFFPGSQTSFTVTHQYLDNIPPGHAFDIQRQPDVDGRHISRRHHNRPRWNGPRGECAALGDWSGFHFASQ